jgi:hypothetical protein
MSDDQNQTPDAPPAESEAPPMREERKFIIRNSVRSRSNRTLRAKQPMRAPLRQQLAGGKYRVLRGRPITLTEREVMEILPELVAKVDAGALEICMLDGRPIDVRTGEPLVGPRVSPPLPNPPMDSIANDKQNVGQRMPQFAGGDTETGDSDVPALVAGAAVRDEEDPPPPPPPAQDDAPPVASTTETAAPPADAPSLEETSEVPALMGGSGDEPVAPDVAPPPTTDAPAPSEVKTGRKGKNK